MPRTVCVKCCCRMRNVKGGIHVVETFGKGSDDPYKLWQADLYECPDCGFQIATGFGLYNYAEHYQDGFADLFQAIRENAVWDKSCG